MTINDIVRNARDAASHSLEAERAVIGSLLLNNNAWHDLGEQEAAHFFDEDNRAVFERITAMIELSLPTDVVTVYESLQSTGHATDIKTLHWSNDRAQEVVSASIIHCCATIVCCHAATRAYHATAQQGLHAVCCHRRMVW